MAIPGSAEAKTVVDDAENIKKFLELMKSKSSSIYTPSTFTSISKDVGPASTALKEAEAPGHLQSSNNTSVSTPGKVSTSLNQENINTDDVNTHSQSPKLRSSLNEVLGPACDGSAAQVHPNPLQPSHRRIYELSPQLVGCIQPPNTPESTPQGGELSIEEITGIIHHSVERTLGSSRAPQTGLSSSIHAPRNGSNRKISIQSIFRPTPPSDTPPNTPQSPIQSLEARRVRDASYSRVSFAAAEAEVEWTNQSTSIDKGESMSNQNGMTKSTDVIALKLASRPRTPPHLRIPPHLRPFIKEDIPTVTERHDVDTDVLSMTAGLQEASQKSSEDVYAHGATSIPDDSGANSSVSSQKFSNVNINPSQAKEAQNKSPEPYVFVPPHLRGLNLNSEVLSPPLRLAKSPVDSSVRTSDNAKPAASQLRESSGPQRPGPITTGKTISTDQGPATARSTPTPSSLMFEKSSPTTTWANSGVSTDNPASSGNLEDAIFLGSWGKPLERDTPAARTRRVKITNLPFDSSASFAASLVYGGAVESIIMGRTFASVLFVNADDCIKYFNQTSNGIVYKTEGKKRHVAFVQKSNDPDVVGGLLREWIEQEVTRCVAVRDLEEDYTLEKLRVFATEGRRLLESIEDGTFPPGVPGRRCVTFRFCRMDHAVQFMKKIRIEPDWEAYTSVYAVDPCAVASEIHF